MTLVQPQAADFTERERVLREFVLKRWAGRCGPECTAEWNATIGKTVGIEASL